jgi:hypothetical protein
MKESRFLTIFEEADKKKAKPYNMQHGSLRSYHMYSPRLTGNRFSIRRCQSLDWLV